MSLPQPYVLGSVWGLSEFGLSLLKRSKAGATSKDRNSLTWIWVVNLGSIALGVWLAYHLPAWKFPWRAAIYLPGCLLFAAGLLLRWHAIFYLGRFFTVNVAIAADHRVIQTGPYRWIRHPSYTGGLTMMLGLCLCIGNLASLLVIAVPCVAVTLWRIRLEEAALARALGAEYTAYMRKTRRLIPWIY